MNIRKQISLLEKLTNKKVILKEADELSVGNSLEQAQRIAAYAVEYGFDYLNINSKHEANDSWFATMEFEIFDDELNEPDTKILSEDIGEWEIKFGVQLIVDQHGHSAPAKFSGHPDNWHDDESEPMEWHLHYKNIQIIRKNTGEVIYKGKVTGTFEELKNRVDNEVNNPNRDFATDLEQDYLENENSL